MKCIMNKIFQFLNCLVIINITIIIDGNVTCDAVQNISTGDVRNVTEANLISPKFEAYEESEIVNNTMLRDILEIQKQDILKRLGFKNLPNATKKNLSDHQLRETLWHFRQSEELIKDETSILFGDDDDSLAVQFYSYTDNGYQSPPLNSTNIDKFVYFDINIYKPHDETRQTIVESAILKLYKSYVKPELVISSDFVDKSVTIKIYQLINDSVEYSRKIVGSRLVSLGNIGWEEFDVSRSIQEWLHDSSTNYRLQIVCDEISCMDDLIHFVTWNDTAGGKSEEVPFSDDDNVTRETPPHLPALNIITRSIELTNTRERSRRWADEKQSNLVEDCGQLECCSHPLEISFEEIGWDWIIHPKNIIISVCSGPCSRSHQHCGVSRYDGLTLVHFDEHLNVLMSLLPSMIPVECKCVSSDV